MKKILFTLLAVTGLPLFAAKPLLISDIEQSQVFSEQDYAQQISNASLAQLKAQSDLSNLQKDYVQYQELSGFAVESLSQEQIKRLYELKGTKPRAYRKHDEGPIAVAFFDVASLAKNILYRSEVNNLYLGLKKSYQNVGLQILAPTNSGISSAEQQAYIKLFKKIDIATLNLLSQSLHKKDKPTKLQLQLAAISAERAPNIASFSYVLNRSDLPEAIRLIEQTPNLFSNVEAIKILKGTVSNNIKLGSYAIAQLGNFSESSITNDYFFNLMASNKVGSSAAMAIARKVKKGDPALVSKLNSMLINTSSTRPQLANAALALKLSGIRLESQQYRELFSQIPQQDIKEEALSWLK